MDQQSTVLAILAMDPGSVLSIPVEWLTTICNSKLKRIQCPLLVSTGAYIHVHIPTHEYTHKHIIFKKVFERKMKASVHLLKSCHGPTLELHC